MPLNIFPKPKFKTYSLLKPQIFSSIISTTLFLWCTTSGFLADISKAQTSPNKPPTLYTPEEIEPFPSQNPPDTFDPNNLLPPEGYSPEPFGENPANQFNVYRLDVGDGITVAVRNFPEFDFTSLIDAEGNVIMPILGRISLVGLTVKEAEAKIRYELSRRYLKIEPEVIVVLAAARPVALTVLGEIVRPGFYTLGAGTPLTSILLSAGGSTPDADLRSIIVRRTLVDGTVIERTVDLFTPLQTGKKVPTVRLQGGDTVIVSRLEVGTDQDYNRTLVARTTLAQPTITIRVLSNAAGGIGTINVPNGSTFLDIIGSVAPNPDVADLRDIDLIRFDPEKGGVVTQSLDAKRAILGDISQNVPLQDEDVIVVGRSLLGKINFILRTLNQPIQSIFGFRAFFESLDNVFQ